MDLLIAALVVISLAAVLTLFRWIDLERLRPGSVPARAGDEWSPDLPSHPYDR